jgi:alanyl-tRNA synthetase
MSKTGKEIRSEFIKFFEDRGHVNVPSSSLLPADDPTLLFSNAGMNQFKSIFLGTETRDYNRAVNTQKCIRAGGKHNDLEDVGRDCYHHTFFEMLGNWSFGDYFKEEAIHWAWELLTKVWLLPKDRLYATVFSGDDADGLAADKEAERLWLRVTDIDPSHLQKHGKKDNFWEMGETGPCGPCSEIHIDLTEDGSGGRLVNAGDPRVIELWNLVFIQFNRDSSGALSPLPAMHVDTGLGLERVTAVLQGKKSNYATDLWTPIIEKIETFTQHRYGSHSGCKDRFDVVNESELGDVACRVIADHARALTFAIADGILPSNDGRGSVLRAILRRAAGFGRQHLQIDGPFISQLVDTVVEQFGDTFPELPSRKAYVKEIIRGEEESFGKTLDRGLALFERQVEKVRGAGGNVISGDASFELHTTYGFPFSLTKLMAEKQGLGVDEDGYYRLMAEHRETSGAGAGEKFNVEAVVGLPETDDSARDADETISVHVLGWVTGDKFITEGELPAGQEVAMVLDKTCFYGEAGGQVGDKGMIRSAEPPAVFEVTDTQLAGDCVLHVGCVVEGTFTPGRAVAAHVDAADRIDTQRNHSATHLLNWALRKVLGPNVNQAGSVVGPDRLRFDFTHNAAVTAEQLAQVERLVNQCVLNDQPITAKPMPLAEAKKIPGVRAVFGEKYPDPVRVVKMDTVAGETGEDRPGEDAAVEFCGGTHLQRTGQVGLFKILSEESVAKGVRRITAVTGRAAVDWAAQADATLKAAAAAMKVPTGEIPQRIVALQKEIKKLRRKPAGGAGGSDELIDTTTLDTPAGKVLVACAGVADPALMRNLCDQQRQKGAVAIFLGAADEEAGKVLLVAMVSDELVKAGKLKAGDWVKQIAPIVGGRGGGKPTLAQAGGKTPRKLPEALTTAADFAKQKLA